MGKHKAALDGPPALPARVLLTQDEELARGHLGRKLPTARAVRLIVDSGSRRSSLVPEVLQALSPMTWGKVHVETSLAVAETSLYLVRLEFPGSALGPIPEWAVARLDMPPSLSAFQGVIGRDLLDGWEYFLYQGRRRQFSVRDAPGLMAWLIG